MIILSTLLEEIRTSGGGGREGGREGGGDN